MSINTQSAEVLEYIAANETYYGIFTDILSLNSPYVSNDRFKLLNGEYDSVAFENIIGYQALTLDEDDSYSVYAYNDCIEQFLNLNLETATLDELNSKYIDRSDTGFFSTASTVNKKYLLKDIRKDFFDNKLFLNTSVVNFFSNWIVERVKLWRNYYHNAGEFNYDGDDSPLATAESVSYSETQAVNQSSESIDPDLNTLLNMPIFVSGSTEGNSLLDMAFGSREKNQSQLNSFYRTFSDINPSFNTLDGSITVNVLLKMEEVGILDLASYAYEIGEFVKRRFVNKTRLQKAIYDPEGESSVIDERYDLPWLIALSEVVTNLKKDAVAFATISYYFPSLITFLIDTIAAIGDYRESNNTDAEDADAFLNSLERAFGITLDGKPIFKLALRASTTSIKIKNVLDNSPYRPNISPENPDIFHLRLGAANFYVPPLGIDVNTAFKTGSLVGGAIRQKNTPKFNSGYKETSINIRLFFPNYEEIWGISIDDGSSISVNENYEIDFKLGGASEAKIDKFLSSLRGLVAAFRYSPILPIKNHYLNSVHGITAVCLSNMTVSTVPNYPFVLAVDLELLNFNHAPFLPMIKDFNQAIHWGKYRQYMGKAAGNLHSYVNESFLLKTSNTKSGDLDNYETIDDELGSLDSIYVDDPLPLGSNSSLVADNLYKNDVFTQNVKREWEDGKHIVFYAPAESQTKIFLPDTSSFRTEQEKLLTDLTSDIWESLLNRIGINIDINQSAGYRIPLSSVVNLSQNQLFSKTDFNLMRDYTSLLTAGTNTDDNIEKTYLTIMTSFIQQNGNKLTPEQKEWLLNYSDTTDTEYPERVGTYYLYDILIAGDDGSSQGISLNAVKSGIRQMAISPQYFLEQITSNKIADQKAKLGVEPDYNLTKEGIARAFNVALYRTFFQLGSVRDVMEAKRAQFGYRFYEWEVPMIKVELDPKSVIINSVNVSIANSFAKMQIQMQDEPTYQHIGGKDSYINISMTVIGEKELIKLKAMFDHISGLARLEHATGVIGFLGIKNIITALCGIKYILPLNYRVSTMPNYPHVYSVEISMVDFDIFQQKREKLSSKQQVDLIKNFMTKKNPFLRIKQMWGSFNAYPDFPLSVKDENGEVVGHLDPDFYFRSFEMFDRDVVNSLTDQTPRVQDHIFDSDISSADVGFVANISAKILEFLRQYSSIGGATAPDSSVALQNLVKDMRDYVATNNIDHRQFVSVFSSLVSTNTDGFTTDLKNNLLTDFLTISPDADENNPYLMEISPAPFKQGDLSPNSLDLRSAIAAMLEGEYSLPDEEYVSFDPDDVDFHKLIHLFPAADEEDIALGQVPATCITALGTHFGYVKKDNGRFYLTKADGTNVVKNPETGSLGFKANLLEDTQTPDRGNTNSNTGVPGAVAISEYQKAYESGGLHAHLEKMMVDTAYRDVSGRMLRAFPTYMLWLIDEGGYFAGAKLFDNFYGLQSIIDFSVVTSEDLLGDTLILRLSNLYSKLTTPASSEIFNPNIDPETGNPVELIDGIEGIVSRTLNFSKNVLSHMRNEYVVDFASIRLKPGVRLHLRAGYGSNPNSLQTIFNGVITNVEPGEVVTVTAQSDAIELGAIINSTDKKGDSGKIDGGINTGLWLSEPRDLMVRLLSMGASRVKESFSRATRGTIFSENKFGIRHFGGILYEPTEMENNKNRLIRESIASAYVAAGSNQSFASKAIDVTAGFSFNTRGNTISAMAQLWSNAAAEIDLEVFKRNIYPGNGTGIAQFLGGDIDDGWLTVASLVPEDSINNRVDSNLGRLTDLAWNNIVAQSGQRVSGANETLDALTEGYDLKVSNSAGVASAVVSGGLLTAGVAAGTAAILGSGGILLPVVGGAFLGSGLLGVLSGRGGTNLYRTLGIISPNNDDDLPGFDEVSFRAQTYMRTVWDLFQMCARLLPNYIVAIRPFEDRSTVFYGKPHWLYTSGVVPVTTGYPGDEEMADLGLMERRYRSPDEDMQHILDVINRDSNPYADINAYFESFEKDSLFGDLASDMMNSQAIYKPTSFLNGKIIDFYSEPAVNKYDNNGNILTKMPTSKGLVGVGLHLPITDGNSTKAELATQTEPGKHSQLNNLPPRFRFPFFSATEDIRFEKNSEVSYNGEYNQNINRQFINDFSSLNIIENNFFLENKITLKPTSETIQLDTALQLDELTAGSARITDAFYENTEYIMMPYPNIGIEGGSRVVLESEVTDEYAFEYQNDIYGRLNYNEWGSPATAEDEQFYIAMRWPYNPENEEIKNQFIDEYFSGVTYLGNQDGVEVTESSDASIISLHGTAADYKERKVLVYSPLTNRAVVCRPAYFMWGESEDTVALVSPDAAYFLGILTVGPEDEVTLDAEENWFSKFVRVSSNLTPLLPEITLDSIDWDSGFRSTPQKQECYMGFVPDNTPVGVVATATTPINKFSLSSSDGTIVERENSYLIGFGKIGSDAEGQADVYKAYAQSTSRQASIRNSLEIYRPYEVEFTNFSPDLFLYGGNPLNVGEGKTYFDAVLNAEYSSLDRSNLISIMNDEIQANPDVFAGGRSAFIPVSSPIDAVGVEARTFYDEDFDASVNVIAGNGRTVDEADEIWNEFRTGYHTFDSVKGIFQQVYNLDPDSEEILPEYIADLILGKSIAETGLKKFNASGDPSALDEFAILLGSDYVDNLSTGQSSGRYNPQENFKQAIEYARQNFIDAPLSEGGLIEYFNNIVSNQFKKIYENFISEEVLRTVLLPDGTEADGTDVDTANSSGTTSITLTPENLTAKQLFLLMVGIFRQRLWEDAYARAWLVLKPDRKRSLLPLPSALDVVNPGGGDSSEGFWSFKPIDKIFREFISPYNDLAKPSKKQKFIQLLASTKSEGNSNTNLLSDAVSGIGNFIDSNIGPIWTALTDGLSALLGMFKLNLQQMGYALGEVGNFGIQANILNKALNDSIYYSLGTPGSMLRAVDNPFTREYGEPVVEIREPFQRIHYISSFSHILVNKIQENLNGVATVVTAVSDGKYPVSVALDKGAPSERQVEKTVETGIYFDNFIGSGFLGALHPLMHPLETARGISKNIQGTPDELLAKRVALAHLRESIKDIYGGEVMLIGSPDIRPHDLVYIADIYERMYGIFEVEQVVHHFTPELGFVTSVTPNALVTVNDPARWFISSWIDSWFNVQTIRNDTRMYLDGIRSANSGVAVVGNLSVDGLSEALSPQITGGMQYTHGSSALSRDLIANQMAQSLPDAQNQLVGASKQNLEGGVRGLNAIIGGVASAIPIVGQLAWKGWKYVRDNLLDQHGCYVQYLNKNGQPMDAGLSYNQGMVVGRYHTKAMLPGILGVRTKVRSPEGYAYIRSDDLFKSLGWQEKEIAGLVRYLSYENALVHARVLKLAGLGPEKAGLQPQYKIICKVTEVKDGDTLKVIDCISGSNSEFNLRFTGIDTSELNVIEGKVDFSEPGTDASIIDISTPAGKAKLFVENAIKDKVIVITVAPKTNSSPAIIEEDYYPGASANNQASYTKDQFDRVLGTIFYYSPDNVVNQNIQLLEGIIRNKCISERYQNFDVQLANVLTESNIKNWVKDNFATNSVFRTKFYQIYSAIDSLDIQNYFNYPNSDEVFSYFTPTLVGVYNNLIYMLNLSWIYEKTNEWPLVSWDEYYDDGHPVTLNWELVVNNLARVYVKDLQTQSDSVIGIDETAGLPRSII